MVSSKLRVYLGLEEALVVALLLFFNGELLF